MEYVRNERHPGHRYVRTALRSATRTELKVMRTVVVSTLKKIQAWQAAMVRGATVGDGSRDRDYRVQARGWF